jgi:glycosyltransferase involved in cell wall biosynthesis
MFLSIKNEKIFEMTVPAKLQAYMGFGKPVIGMISGEGAQIIEESEGGFAVRGGDFESLVEKVRQFRNLQQIDREAMGNNNKAYYKENFSLLARQQQLRNILNN